MKEKSIHNIPFTGEKEKFRILLREIVKSSGIKGYYIILRGEVKTPVVNSDEKYTDMLKIINKKA